MTFPIQEAGYFAAGAFSIAPLAQSGGEGKGIETGSIFSWGIAWHLYARVARGIV